MIPLLNGLKIMFKFISIVIIIFTIAYAEEKNIYDPDSLVVLEILDSNGFSHDYFYDVVWHLGQVSVNDSDWRIYRLYLKAGDPQSVPPILPGKLCCLPSSIGDLFCLNWLEVPHHNLEKIPDEISKLENVGILDLRYNPLKNIQSEIAQISRLAYLGLSHTDITSMPDEFLDLDSMRPCNIAVDTINGNIYPIGVIDLCGLENFTLTERQKAWAGVADYEEYKQKYCQETAVKEPDVNSKKPVASGIHAVVTGYTLRLTLKREGVLSLSLYNSSGRHVSVIFRRKSLSKGSHSIQLSKNIPPGVYFLRGKIGGMRFSRRVVVTGGI